MIVAYWESKFHEGKRDTLAMADNVVIANSKDQYSEDETNNWEFYTTQEEEGDNLQYIDGELAFKDWDPWDIVVTRFTYMMLSIIKTIGFDPIKSVQDIAMVKRNYEDLLIPEIGKARELGLHIFKELTGVDLMKTVSTISRTDGKS